MSTFHRLSSFILRTPAAFTTPSVAMIRMLPVRAWCPRYRPTYSIVCIPLATALVTAGQQTHSPNFATTFFQARPERCIQAVKPPLPILKKLIASAAIVGIHLKTECDATIFPTCASRANFRVRVCRFTSRMADSATPFVACSPTVLSRKTDPPNDGIKVAVLRATIDGSPSLCNIALRYPSRRNKDTNHDVAYSCLQHLS